MREYFDQTSLDLVKKLMATDLKRNQVLTLVEEIGLACPNSNSVCSQVVLRRTSERDTVSKKNI